MRLRALHKRQTRLRAELKAGNALDKLIETRANRHWMLALGRDPDAMAVRAQR